MSTKTKIKNKLNRKKAQREGEQKFSVLVYLDGYVKALEWVLEVMGDDRT